MQKGKDTKGELADILLEAKKYYGLQKDYLRYTAAEQLTRLVSTLAIVAVVAIVALVIFVFAGMAIVHWLGAAIQNIALCYALYALFLIILLLIFYLNRRRWVILPLARLMTSVFLKEKEEEDEEE